MNTFVKLFNNAFIISNGLLKFKNIDWSLIKLLIDWRIQIKFHSKLLTMIKYALKNEIIKLNVKYFSLKPWPNGNYGLLKGQNWTLFQKSFWIGFFVCFFNKIVPYEHVFKIFILYFIRMDFMGFEKIPSDIHHNKQHQCLWYRFWLGLWSFIGGWPFDNKKLQHWNLTN